jgi:hypothetical protein
MANGYSKCMDTAACSCGGVSVVAGVVNTLPFGGVLWSWLGMWLVVCHATLVFQLQACGLLADDDANH